jgi:hypothetical protein
LTALRIFDLMQGEIKRREGSKPPWSAREQIENRAI